MAKTRAPHPADALSFTRLRPKSEWKPAGLRPRCWWSVTAADVYLADEQTGRAMGLQYLTYEAADAGGGSVLALIVADMPRDLGAIEIAFLTMVALAASAGRPRAARVSAYWDDCMKREAANGWVL